MKTPTLSTDTTSNDTWFGAIVLVTMWDQATEYLYMATLDAIYFDAP